MKTCSKCKVVKPSSNFYKGSGKYLTSSNCKECCKAYNHSELKRRLDRDYQRRKRAADPAAKKEANYLWQSQNPQKHVAHMRVGTAIRYGRLVKRPCEVCNTEPAQAHHPDYNKVLEVRWLCSSHHKMVHLGTSINYQMKNLLA